MVWKRFVAAVAGLAVLPGCLEQRPFAALDRPSLVKAAGAAGLRKEKGAVLLVRITKDGEGCFRGKARLRTLESMMLGGESYTAGQKGALDDLPAVDQISAQLKAVFTLNVPALIKQSEVSAPDIAYVSVAPGTYLLTRIECSQSDTRYSMGLDFGQRERAPMDVRMMPVRGANQIVIKPGEIIDAGALDIQEREHGFWKTTGEVVSSPTPDAYRQMIQTKLPDLAAQTTYRTFAPFSACQALKAMRPDPKLLATACSEEAAASGPMPDTASLDTRKGRSRSPAL